MTRRTIGTVCAAAFACVLAVATPAGAQQTSSIAGIVRDSSGGVLPGVTVEAASPALIEKVRTAVTDGQGRFNIVDLRPGTYTVTFSLPGFNAVKREGVQLTAGFTAAINADLQVGAVEETITVSGETPIIDTQNTRQQKVVSNELLEALPSGQMTAINVVNLTPGMTTVGLADVGGSLGTYNAGGNGTTFHGKTGFKREFDGMRVENMEGDGPLVAPQTMFEPRRTQVDLRLTKVLTLPRGRLQLNFDVDNALNASDVVTLNTNYGPSWLQPTSFLTGRLYEVGGQWSF